MYSVVLQKQEQRKPNTSPKQENNMFNMFNPQSMVNQFDYKTKAYAESVLDTIEAFQVSSIKAFDQFTNNIFDIYSSRAITALKEVNENAKEIVKTGKFKSFANVGHKG